MGDLAGDLEILERQAGTVIAEQIRNVIGGVTDDVRAGGAAREVAKDLLACARTGDAEGLAECKAQWKWVMKRHELDGFTALNTIGEKVIDIAGGMLFAVFGHVEKLGLKLLSGAL